MAEAAFKGLVVMKGGGINSSLLSKKENRSTELGLGYFCLHGYTAYCNAIIYKQEFSMLIKNGSGGLNKLPVGLKDNGLNVVRISFCDRVNKQITGKIHTHPCWERLTDYVSGCCVRKNL